MNKTKIVCTIGPITSDEESLKKLISSGMTMARLNGSHNTEDWHRSTIRMIRNVDPYLPILFDLPGRKIRTSLVDHDHSFAPNEQVIFTTQQDYSGKEKVVVNYDNLHSLLQPTDTILADDGTLKFEVIQITDQDIICQAKTAGKIKPSKGINVPYIKMDSPLVSQKDIDLINLCIEEGVDFVGVSFVDSGEQLQEVYKFLKESTIEVIAKVENQFGIDNLDSIIKNSFAILIDRGDLAAETKVTNIPIIQKKIIQSANMEGKPVIVATEMLHTMMENPFPTKSEVNDIANAIIDGATALMLSGETAAGKYPFKACKLMQEVAIETEQNMLSTQENISYKRENNTSNIIARSVNEASRNLDITKILAITYSGFSARMIALHRPSQPIIVVTDTIEKSRQFNLFWGVQSVVGNFDFKPTDGNNSIEAIEYLYRQNILKNKDMIVLTAVRFPNPNAFTTMNFLEIHKVKDLSEIFQWNV